MTQRDKDAALIARALRYYAVAIKSGLLLGTALAPIREDQPAEREQLLLDAAACEGLAQRKVKGR